MTDGLKEALLLFGCLVLSCAGVVLAGIVVINLIKFVSFFW